MEVILRFESENLHRMIEAERKGAWYLNITIRGTPAQVERIKEIIRHAVFFKPSEFPQAKEE